MAWLSVFDAVAIRKGEEWPFVFVRQLRKVKVAEISEKRKFQPCWNGNGMKGNKPKQQVYLLQRTIAYRTKMCYSK